MVPDRYRQMDRRKQSHIYKCSALASRGKSYMATTTVVVVAVVVVVTWCHTPEIRRRT